MTDWRTITAAARNAGRLLIRNRRAGEAEFESLLRSYPRDGMLFHERGIAHAAVGDAPGARSDLQQAVHLLPRPEFKRRAEEALARIPTPTDALPPLAAVTPVQAGLGVSVPTAEELGRAHNIFHANEPRAVDFEVALRLLEDALRGTHHLSVATPVALLLQSWNFAYYQNDKKFDASHYAAIETVLSTEASVLNTFRRRRIETLADGDEPSVKRLFEALRCIVGRVGAAKVLHLWAPAFFPLWDNPIAEAYRLDLREPVDAYWQFLLMVREQLASLPALPGVNSLKALDEYNYCRFSKCWLTT